MGERERMWETERDRERQRETERDRNRDRQRGHFANAAVTLFPSYGPDVSHS